MIKVSDTQAQFQAAANLYAKAMTHDENRHRSALNVRKEKDRWTFHNSMAVAASGMRAQSDRMKVIAENIANANSTSPTPGGDPYRRKIATVTPDFDRELGANLVEAGKPSRTRAISAANTIPAIPMPTSRAM